jgi:hypothetical protein
MLSDDTESEHYPSRGKAPLMGKVDLITSDRAIERARMLSPASRKKVFNKLRNLPLPSTPRGAATSFPDEPDYLPDEPGYLVYVLAVHGEPDVAIIYRFTHQHHFMRRRFWIADIRGDHLPKD